MEARPVPGFTGYYVTACGRVFSIMEMKEFLHNDGYLRVCTFSNQERQRPGVHTMVAAAFHGARPPGMVVRHLDGNKSNNAPENLKWGTHQENSLDTARHGRLKGARRSNSILTEDGVREIRRLKKDGVRRGELAARFGVSKSAIDAVVEGRNWGYVT